MDNKFFIGDPILVSDSNSLFYNKVGTVHFVEEDSKGLFYGIKYDICGFMKMRESQLTSLIELIERKDDV